MEFEIEKLFKSAAQRYECPYQIQILLSKRNHVYLAITHVHLPLEDLFSSHNIFHLWYLRNALRTNICACLE